MITRSLATVVLVVAGGLSLAGCNSVPPDGADRDYRREFRGRNADHNREFCRMNPGDQDCFGRRF